MLEVMRNPDASWHRRDEMAKAAAPYLHASLRSSTRVRSSAPPVERLTDNELNRRIAELSKAVKDDAASDAAPDDPSKLD
jgi:hypothetical protein